MKASAKGLATARAKVLAAAVEVESALEMILLERLKAVQRKFRNSTVTFASGMGVWGFAIDYKSLSLPEFYDDPELDAIWGDALSDFGWMVIPTGDWAIIDGVARRAD